MTLFSMHEQMHGMSTMFNTFFGIKQGVPNVSAYLEMRSNVWF